MYESKSFTSYFCLFVVVLAPTTAFAIATVFIVTPSISKPFIDTITIAFVLFVTICYRHPHPMSLTSSMHTPSPTSPMPS